MFENIFKGLYFIKESFNLVMKDADVIKPSFYSIFVGMFFTIFSVIIMLLVRSGQGSEYVFYMLAAVILLGNYLISYFFTGMTAFLVYDYFKDGDATMSEAWDAARRNMITILFLAVISTIVNIILGMLRGRTKNRGLSGGFSDMITGVIEKSWTAATYFIVPAIVIEDRTLKSAVERATQIIAKNLLPVGVGEIAVGLVTGIISFIGFIVAAAVGFSLIASVGPVIAVLLAAIVAVVVIALSMYVNTAYHTCLFLWARKAESSGVLRKSIIPPAPLANTLGIS